MLSFISSFLYTYTHLFSSPQISNGGLKSSTSVQGTDACIIFHQNNEFTNHVLYLKANLRFAKSAHSSPISANYDFAVIVGHKKPRHL